MAFRYKIKCDYSKVSLVRPQFFSKTFLSIANAVQVKDAGIDEMVDFSKGLVC